MPACFIFRSGEPTEEPCGMSQNLAKARGNGGRPFYRLSICLGSASLHLLGNPDALLVVVLAIAEVHQP